MIVELVGPPGAGKSTLLPATCALLARDGHPALESTAAVDQALRDSRLGRRLVRLFGDRGRRSRAALVDIPYGILFALRHGVAAREAARAVLSSPVRWEHRALLFWRFLSVAARSEFLRSRMGEGAAVFDEGLLHRAVNLFAWRRTGSLAAARRYLEAVPPPDLAILVDAPDELISARMERRGLPGRLRGRSRSTVTAFIGNACAITRMTPDTTRSRVRWIEVQNARDLASAERGLAQSWDRPEGGTI